MSKTISIFNQKGGVGKTTTAVNLSAAMSMQNKNILLLDFDPQGNATSGVMPIGARDTIYEALIDKVEIKSIIKKTDYQNLYLIPSDSQLSGLEVELASIGNWERLLEKKLEPIKKDYDYIIIDCPPSLGILSMMAMLASDSLLIPIQCEYYSLEGVSKLYSTYLKVKKKLNPELDIEGVLITMADFRTNLSKTVKEEVESFFKEKVFKTHIPRNISLAEAPGFGKPAVMYAPSSSGSQAYINLAEEILKGGR